MSNKIASLLKALDHPEVAKKIARIVFEAQVRDLAFNRIAKEVILSPAPSQGKSQE